MLTIAPQEGTRMTYTDTPNSTDSLFFGADSQMDLAVSWNGREPAFEIVEFSTEEIVVSGFRVADLDLCQHEASIDFCDGELLDEVHCRVVFRGFDGPGVARLRIVADVRERIELMRFSASLRQRLEAGRALEQACLAAACGWI